MTPSSDLRRATTVAHITTVHRDRDARIFYKECRSLAAAGYDVVQIAPGSGPEEIVQGVRCIAVTPPASRRDRFIGSQIEMIRRLWPLRADVIHYHDAELLFVGLLMRLRGARVVYDVHEDLPRDIRHKPWLPSAVRIPASFAASAVEFLASRLFLSGIVSATPQIAERFPARTTATVMNFADVSDWLSAVGDTPYRARSKSIAYVGAVARVRDIVETIEAVAEVAHPELRLRVAGPFNTGELENELRQLRGAERCEFLGWLERPQVAELLGQSRAGLLLLHPIEQFLVSYPLKLFEYMCAGLPVIASDFPLWREMLEHVGCCIFVDPLDRRAIASAIDWVLDNPDEAEAMGSRGRAAIERGEFSWAGESAKLVSFYDRLVGGKLDLGPRAQ